MQETDFLQSAIFNNLSTEQRNRMKVRCIQPAGSLGNPERIMSVSVALLACIQRPIGVCFPYTLLPDVA